jgi:uncharacterized membrane protein YiaA
MQILHPKILVERLFVHLLQGLIGIEITIYYKGSCIVALFLQVFGQKLTRSSTD